MNCPICRKEISYDQLQCLIPCLSSDASFATAETYCEHCGDELEFYYVLKEINGEEV